MSGKTALLVTDGANTTTRKAIAAQERGIRVVSPAVFGYMVSHVLTAAVPLPGPRTSPSSAITPTAAAAAHVS